MLALGRSSVNSRSTGSAGSRPVLASACNLLERRHTLTACLPSSEEVVGVASERGFVLIADITGYTVYLSGSELACVGRLAAWRCVA
jgi:hypothetical protein